MDAAQVLTLLEPWYQSIQKIAHSPPDVFAVMAQARAPPPHHVVLWIETGGYAGDIKRKHVEGLELFALLARVDWELWKRALHANWPSINSKYVAALDELVPTTVGIYFGLNDVDVELELVATTRRRVQDPASSAFVELRDMLLSMASKRQGIPPVIEVPVRFSIHFTWQRHSLLFRMVQAVIMQRHYPSLPSADTDNATAAGGGQYQGLCIRAFMLHLGEIMVDIAPLRYVMDAVSYGVAIEDVGEIKFDVYRDYPIEYVHATRTLYAIGGGASNHRGATQVTLKRVLKATMVPGIFSAIRASESIRTVVIDPCMDKLTKKRRPMMWSWIAYALFVGKSKDPATIPKISLTVQDLSIDDVDAMKKIVQAPDPLVVLLGRTASLHGHSISASRFSLHNPTTKDDDTASSATYVSHRVVSDLEVLKRTKAWTTVLLPGWGHAWVHCDDVLAQERAPKASTKVPASVQSIVELTLLGMTATSADAVLAFLELGGRDLKRLTVKHKSLDRGNGDVPLDDWCRRLFQICPKLDSLRLENVLIYNLQLFEDCYVSETCRLRRLVLVKPLVRTLLPKLKRFFSVLSDCTHPAAHHLEAFVYTHSGFRCLEDPEIVATMVTMLERNRCLRELDLRAIGWNEFDRKKLEPVLAFDGQQLGTRCGGAVNRKLQLAFLSVVTPVGRDRDNDGPKKAVESLDACVLSLIFQFAATCHTRIISIERSNTPPS